MKTLRDLFDITVHPTCAWPRHLDVPLYVMGAGAGTAWLTLFHTCIEPGAAVDVARSEVVLDAVLVVAFLLLALLARRCSPYARRPSVIALVCVATMAGTAISVLGAGSPLLFLLGGGAAMMGIALSILLWDEFYSCLSPARIALYVSCSALAGEVFRVVLLGFNPTYLAVGMALLPLVSTLALVRAFRSLTADELPQGTTTATARAVPWTLIAVVAAYALCYGLVAKTSESSVALTVISKPLPALIIIASIVLQSEQSSAAYAACHLRRGTVLRLPEHGPHHRQLLRDVWALHLSHPGNGGHRQPGTHDRCQPLPPLWHSELRAIRGNARRQDPAAAPDTSGAARERLRDPDAGLLLFDRRNSPAVSCAEEAATSPSGA